MGLSAFLRQDGYDLMMLLYGYFEDYSMKLSTGRANFYFGPTLT